MTLDTPSLYGKVCSPPNTLNLDYDIRYHGRTDSFDDGDPVQEWISEIGKIMNIVYIRCSDDCQYNVSWLAIVATTLLKVIAVPHPSNLPWPK